MRHDYTFAEALEYTHVDRNRLMRWADEGIVRTTGGGSQGKRREFSLRMLAEVAVCDELRFLQVDERLLRQAVTVLNQWWDGQLPESRGATVLWIGHQRVPDLVLDVDGAVKAARAHLVAEPDFPKDRLADTERVLRNKLSGMVAARPEMETGDVLTPWLTDAKSAMARAMGDEDGIPETGIIVPVRRIVEDLEKATGDKLE
jgi:hypothetical protein